MIMFLNNPGPIHGDANIKHELTDTTIKFEAKQRQNTSDAVAVHATIVFPTRVIPNPRSGFFQPPNPDILKKLELLLHSNISNSDNTEVADWGV